ncbi:MAG: hypothetical protein JW850_13440 [Thermoflexales bacterium]|nr:hypothetical protein [Thermoflexales bacterium]
MSQAAISNILVQPVVVVRDTFSINFLRNGGNVFTLQTILGHATMKMVKKYLALAQADVEAGHRQASPVANWRL